MVFVEIPYSPAVGNEIAVKAPAFQLIHKVIAGAGGLAVYPVVSAHNSLNPSLFNESLKGGKIGFLKFLFGNFGVEFVAQLFGAAVNGEMLCTGGCL